VIREEYVERAALIEHVDIGNEALEGDVVAVVTIDPVQTRRTAGDVIGLLLDDETEPRLGGTCRRTLALVLGARQVRGYNFVSKSSCP
jgi:hypothetical protein